MGIIFSSVLEKTTIMDLPEEIRGLIFNKLSQKEILNLQLVSQQFNKDVKNYFDYEIQKLDETSLHFNSILQLRIKTLKIHKLKQSSNLTLKYPNLITALEFGPQATISQDSLIKLLHQCCKHLKSLSIDMFPLSYFQFLENTGFNFMDLNDLTIKWQSLNSNSSIVFDQNLKGILNVLEHSTMPKLKFLYVNFYSIKLTAEAKACFVGCILRMISKNGKFLEYLNFHIDGNVEIESGVEVLQRHHLSNLHQIKLLKDFDLHLEPIGIANRWFYQDFLSNQNNLEVMFIQPRSPLAPISIPFCRQIIAKNFDTLVLLILVKIMIPDDGSKFDLVVFQNCTKLRKVDLRRDRNIIRANPMESDVINFHCLPPNITKLTLHDLRVLSIEMNVAFDEKSTNSTSTEGFTKLRRFEFQNCGNQGPNGLNGFLLRKIVRLESLLKIKIRNSLNRSASDEADWRILRSILTPHVGIQNDDYTFVLIPYCNKFRSSMADDQDSDSSDDELEHVQTRLTIQQPNILDNFKFLSDLFFLMTAIVRNCIHFLSFLIQKYHDHLRNQRIVRGFIFVLNIFLMFLSVFVSICQKFIDIYELYKNYRIVKGFIFCYNTLFKLSTAVAVFVQSVQLFQYLYELYVNWG